MKEDYPKNPPSLLSKIISILLILLLLGLIGALSYYLYLNVPRNPEILDIAIKLPTESEPVFSKAIQFYSNMKFNHNRISYNIDQNCESNEKQRILMAFNELSNKVNLLSFFPTSTNPDIEISCSESNKPGIKEKHFVAGEGGAKEIIQTGKYNIITEGVILLYENSDLKTIDCDYPNVELHEIMHVFGFDHVNNQKSLMYPFIETCDQVLDSSIIERLNMLYSQENLPDLSFQNVSLIKKGRYIDFDITIKNTGTTNSENVTLTILDNDEAIETRDLGKFLFGSGITLLTENLKLNRLNPEKITFIIDIDNKIKELDEENNRAIVELK